MARSNSWDGDGVGGLVGLTVVITVLIFVVVGKVAVATIKEIGRVYTENLSDSKVSKILWSALAGLFSLWLLCGVVATVAPMTAAPCLYAAGWGFLIYVIGIEIVDWCVRPGLPRRGDRDSLDTYLGNLGQESAAATGVK